MEKKSFERFGLTGNPFRDLASETIDHVDIFHVDMEMDKEIKYIADEVIDKENKAVIAILGGLGVGKTQRLMLLSNMAKRKELFYILRTMTPETKWAVKGILDAIIEEIPLTVFEKYVTTPKWLAEIKKISKRIYKGKGHDPVTTGKLIAEALNKKAPSFLLINDLQAIPKSKDLSDFIQTLYIVINNIEPGVMVAITSNKFFFDDLMKENEAFDQRINKKFNIKNLTPKQAEHLIAKRLLARRLTDDLGLIYPFTKDSVKILNDEVIGNPRQILRIADQIIDTASKSKSIEVNDEFVINYIKEQKGREMLPPAPRDIENDLLNGRSINVNIPKAKQVMNPNLPKGHTPLEATIINDQTPQAIKPEPKKKVNVPQPEPATKEDRKKDEEKKNNDPFQQPTDKVAKKPETDMILDNIKSDLEEEPSKDASDEDKLDLSGKPSRKHQKKVIVKEKVVEKTPKLDLDLPSVPMAPSSGFIKSSRNTEISTESNDKK